MKAKITFCIGAIVSILGVAQLLLEHNTMGLITVCVGLFLTVFGWKIGWTDHRYFTVALGHAAIAVGLLLVTYGLYQIRFAESMPTLPGILDVPLFWGLFTSVGGHCMIKHGSCACCVRMHEAR